MRKGFFSLFVLYKVCTQSLRSALQTLRSGPEAGKRL